ncbi:hypothetical protein B0H19DRAFT_1145845 [Mycena capillaripes]|nr:hypothetical protein B0H19DRAFT_1145845 [Mycena capillaripes]
MFSATFSRLSIFLALSSCAIAAPMSNLETRATCGDGNPSPCICNNALGLRLKSLKCGNQSFKFKNPASSTDGTVSLVSGNSGSLQCGDIVELQFIADEISKVPAICAHFTGAGGQADFQSFFNTINTGSNLVFVESTVNNAKGIVFGGNSFVGTTSKAASGVVSYLKLLQANGAKNVNPGNHVATTIDAAMTAAGGGNGFTSFQSRWDAEVSAAITKAQSQVSKLAPAPAAGDPFVDETASTIAKCKRGLWEKVQDLVVRATTGKPAATAAQCALKPAAKPTAAAAKKPVAVKPVAKKPVAVKPKPAVKKPAVRSLSSTLPEKRGLRLTSTPSSPNPLSRSLLYVHPSSDVPQKITIVSHPAAKKPAAKPKKGKSRL